MLKSIERVLVPIDQSKPALQAAWIALSIARSVGASMALMHIHIQEKALREVVFIEPDEVTELTEEKYEVLLKKIVGDPSYKALQSAVDHGKVEIQECTYHPSDEICNYAKEKQINLIVMGSRVHSKLGDFLLGNVSTEVLHKAPCPVTIVH